MIRVFLDANIYFAGFHSKEGASWFILELARRKKLVLIASRIVLREADRNLRKKASPAAVKSFHRFLRENKIQVSPSLPEAALAPYESFIHPKDVPILAAAVLSKAEYLITLDVKHFFTEILQSKIKKPPIITPGDFLKQVYQKGKI